MSSSSGNAHRDAVKRSGKPTPPLEPVVSSTDIDSFEQIAAQLTALHKEFAVQAKSKPDNPINTFKVGMVNSKLSAANQLIGSDKPFEEFEVFDANALPSNSDVALVLSAYIASLERWRSARVQYDSGAWNWRTGGQGKFTAMRPTGFNPTEK